MVDRQLTAGAEAATATGRAEQRRPNGRRLRLLLVAAGVILVGAVLAAVITADQRNGSQELADAADGRAAALHVGGLIDEDLVLARLVAAEAHALGPGTETAAALFDAVTADGRRLVRREAPLVDPIVVVDEKTGQVVAIDDRTVARWDVEDGNLLDETTLPDSSKAVAISPTGEAIVLADLDVGASRLRVTDLAGTEQWSTAIEPGEINGARGDRALVGVSNGGERIVTRSSDQESLWVRSSEEEVRMDLPGGGPVSALAISPDGGLVASASLPHPPKSEPAGVPAGPLDPATEPPPPTGVEPTVTDQSMLRLIDPATGDTIWSLRSSSPVAAMRFSPDGSWLAVELAGTSGAVSTPEPSDLPNAVDPMVVVVSVGSGEVGASVRPGNLMGWAGESVGVLSGSWVTLWSPDLAEVDDLPLHVPEGRTFTGDQPTVAMGGGEGRVAVVHGTADRWRLSTWDRSAASGLTEGPLGPSGLEDVVLLGDGRALTVRLSLDPSGVPVHLTSLVDLSDGRTIAEQEGRSEGVSDEGHVLIDGRRHSLADLAPVGGRLAGPWSSRLLSPDGRTVAVIDQTSVGWLDVTTGRNLAPALELDAEPFGLTFSGDGRRMAVLAYPNDVVVVDVATGHPIEHRFDEIEGVRSVDLNGDGSLLAVGTSSGEAWVSRMEGDSYGATLPLPLSSDAVVSIRFVDDASGPTLVATVDESGSTSLFDIEAASVTAHPVPLPVVAVGDVVDDEGDRRLWLATPVGLSSLRLGVDVWSTIACESAGRVLTVEESARYFPGRAPRATCGG